MFCIVNKNNKSNKWVISSDKTLCFSLQFEGRSIKLCVSQYSLKAVPNTNKMFTCSVQYTKQLITKIIIEFQKARGKQHLAIWKDSIS